MQQNLRRWSLLKFSMDYRVKPGNDDVMQNGNGKQADILAGE